MAVVAAAHELGTLRTFVTFHRDGGFVVELIVDREHLPPGFGAAVPGPAPRIEGLTPVLEKKIGGILFEACRGARPAFDGRPAAYRISLARAPGETDAAVDAASELRLLLQGTIPPGARTFTWSNAVPLGTYMLTLESEGQENVERQWLENGKESAPFALAASIVPPTRAQVIRTYLALGYTHILPKGTDHILFVLGIFLLSTRLKPVLLQVTAFTVAHTITLVFAFGLLHGMGFAGVLTQLGLPRSEFLPALISFNVGVEAGQLTVIGIALILFGLPFREKPWYRSRIVVPASVTIAAVGFYWAVQRIVIH